MRARRLVVVAILAAAVLGLSACSSKAKVTPPAPPTDARGKTTFTIDARGNQFSPAALIVTVGTKVTWRNDDAVTHNVKKSADAVDFGATFGTDSFNPDATYSFTFTKPGTYFYTCTIHTLMDGKVEVVAR